MCELISQIDSNTMPGYRHSQPIPAFTKSEWADSGWVMGVRVFRRNLPSALLAEWPGSFTCHYCNTGMERTSNKTQHRKLTLEKKILPPLLSRLEPQPRDHESSALPTSYPGMCVFKLNCEHGEYVKAAAQD